MPPVTATKKPATTPVKPVVVPTVSIETPVQPTEKKVKQPKKDKEVKAPEPVAPVVSEESTAPTGDVEMEEESFEDAIKEFETAVAAINSYIQDVKLKSRSLIKRAKRQIKIAEKSTKRKRKAGNKQPSGFVKPTKITPELAAFLGKPAGYEVARTEVTKLLTEYVKEHSLQNPTNGREIIPNKELAALLGYDAATESKPLTYFNLQTYMKRHFIASPKVKA